MTTGVIAVIGAVTTAVRLEKAIGRETKLTVRVLATPKAINNGGCSYSVKTKAENLPILMEVATKYKIRVKEYYLVEINNGKEEYHAIS